MRIIRTIPMLMAAVLICGCSRSDENVKLQETRLTVTAGFAENDNTKTTLQGEGTAVYWEPGDEIKLFFNSTGGRFTNDKTELSGTAQFSGSLNVSFGSNEGFSDATPLIGLYPYRADATADNSSIMTTLPSDQTGRAGSFARGMNISVSKSSSLIMSYYNVCGGVRFSVTRSDVKEVSFKALNGESIAGRVKIGFSGGVPVISDVIEGKDSITLTAPGGGVFETGKWYYIVVLPGKLSGGFEMTFNTDTKYAVLKSTDERTVKRGIFGSIADADDGLVYKDKETPGPSGDNIVFKDLVAKVACVEKFDTDSDGEVSYAEAAAVTSIAGLFTDYNSVTRFDELKYFTGISDLGSALNGLKSLKSVTVPAGFTTLEDAAFAGCSALDSVTFAGNAVKTIGSGAFQSCTSLREITLPSAVESFGEYAFCGCSTLESIEIPSGVKSLGSYAFADCKKVSTVSLPTSVTSLANGSFSGCSALETASLPSGLTSLPSELFKDCTKLYAITFPTALASIGDRTFYNCPFYNPSTNISKVDLPETVTSIGDEALSRVRNVMVHSSAMVSIGANTFSTEASLYVPDSKVEIYKVKTNWSGYADHICALSSYTDNPVLIEAVDLGLSVKWASCNVGAYWEEECGDYYAWGEIETKSDYSWSTYFDSIDGTSSNFSKYDNGEGGKTVLDSEDDVAHVKWGGSWRMPTKDEWRELYDNCTWTWTEVGGVYGRLVTSKKEGYTDKSIFLPAAGSRKYSGLNSVGSLGHYWSSSLDLGSNYYAWCPYFYSGYVYMSSTFRYLGHSVRPVTE